MFKQPHSKRVYHDETPVFNSGYTVKRPGVIAILIDQSLSMGRAWSKKKGAEDDPPETKATIAADSVNKIVREIIGKCRGGNIFKRKVYLAIAGYGTDATGENARIDVICDDWIDLVAHRWWTGTGEPPPREGMVQPRAEGGTPMATVFQHATAAIREILKLKGIQQSFPPTVINITDGRASDKSEEGEDGEQTRAAADELCSIRTDFGSLNLINIYIDPDNKGDVFFQLPAGADEYAKFLFELATPLPKYMRERAKEKKFHVPDNARGFVITHRPEALVQVLRWGSVPVE